MHLLNPEPQPVVLLTREEAAARAGTSIGTIQRANLPKYRQGKRRVFFRSDDVDALARSLRRQVTVWPSQQRPTA